MNPTVIRLLERVQQGMSGNYRADNLPTYYLKGDLLKVIPADNLPEDSEIKYWVYQDGWEKDSVGFGIYEGTFDVVEYEPEHLHKWKYPSNYFGEDYSEFFVFMSITRDSDILEESNWNSFLEDYPEGFDWDTNKGILVQRASHWAVGWVDTIYIHESDYELLQVVDKIREDLDNYPVYDEDDFSERESEYQYSSVKDEIENFIRHDYDLEELSDKQIDLMIYWYVRECNSNDSLPNEEEFYELYERVLNYKECKTCKDYNEETYRLNMAGIENDREFRKEDFDTRFEYCGCQMALPLE